MNPYLALLRENRNFRMLFIGQTISQLGDWFRSVAVFALLLDLTGSATAVAWMMIVQFLPVTLVGPMAGVVVDRVDRRRLMIATDILRGVFVLGLLLVQRADQVWIAYVAMTLAVAAQAFFEPARTATIPNVTTPAQLMPANALSSAMWSTMLAVGASVGGLVTAVAGRNVSFVINALAFFASAWFILQTRFDAAPPTVARPRGTATLLGLTDLAEGLRYVRAHSHVAALIFVKAGWGLAGGVLLLLTVFGQRVFPVAGSTAAGIGVLYGARGVGAALGPIMLRWILGQEPRTLRRSIGPAYFMVGAFYVALAGTSSLPLAALCVLCAHFGGSILWVFSTVLLQLEVPDRFRGRVFAVELALVTLMMAASSYATAYGLDAARLSPHAMAFVLGALFGVSGTTWLVVESKWKETAPVAVAEPTVPQDEQALEDQIR